MLAPLGLPPRIRTDSSNPFAQHTMAVRVPAILEAVLTRNPDLEPRGAARVQALGSPSESMPACSAARGTPTSTSAERSMSPL